MCMLLFYVVREARLRLTHFLVDERQSVETCHVLLQKFDVLGWEFFRVYGVIEVALVSVAAGGVRIEEVRAIPFAQAFRVNHPVTGRV